jgi:peptidoglycan/xylan/chitin deacetylase (PgdA/CDA1 family)
LDPNALVEGILSERYVAERSGRARRNLEPVALATYYALRPLLPRTVQMSLRRSLRRVQDSGAAFPRWPTETVLHDLCQILLGLLDEVAGEPIPRLAAWPGGHSWAFVLTHDVETAAGYQAVSRLLDIETERGLRSAWYLVPERDYAVDDGFVKAMKESGFEIGVHGLLHDGRDLDPGWLGKRLPAMHRYAERWGATGFRSPATHRNWDVMAGLGFDYDSSYCDVARYEPQPGGCCWWFPFFIDRLVELPITMPMDHSLFEVLRQSDGAVWLEKAAFLRERGGMALLLTHPDYMLDDWRLAAYEELLDAQSGAATTWHALPREVCSWWRRRAASTIERVDGA